jgi:hypothetical protein
MTHRKVYHVVPAPEGGWRIVPEGGKRASGTAERKADALARGRELAKSQPLGQMIVHGKNGQIQVEYTYGQDPHPPDG